MGVKGRLKRVEKQLDAVGAELARLASEVSARPKGSRSSSKDPAAKARAAARKKAPGLCAEEGPGVDRLEAEEGHGVDRLEAEEGHGVDGHEAEEGGHVLARYQTTADRRASHEASLRPETVTGRSGVPLSEVVTVVIATRNRCGQLLAVLDRLLDIEESERPEVIVVDNASTDGTAAAVRRADRGIGLVVLDRNEGAVARNIGAATASTPVVAFADDDSWWAPGSLRAAADLLVSDGGLGLVSARVLVGPRNRIDPVSELMARSPLGSPGRRPGLRVLGFLACSAAVRRTAFLEVGGFSRTLGFLGEESLLAIDLAAAGWDVRYHQDLVVHHWPQPQGRRPARRQVRQTRNDLLVTWLRRSRGRVAVATATLAARSLVDPTARGALVSAVAAAPDAVRQRRPVPAWLESELLQLAADRTVTRAGARRWRRARRRR